jgi:hypothetical protein
MFVRDHLAVVSHWARDQLREGAETPEQGKLLKQLIEAAEALRLDLIMPGPETAPNVIPLDEFRHAAH